MTFVWYIT